MQNYILILGHILFLFPSISDFIPCSPSIQTNLYIKSVFEGQEVSLKQVNMTMISTWPL